MAIGGVNLGQELLNVPMGDMIRSIALAIADAQWALDKSSMVVTELMSGQRLLRDLETGELMDAAGRRTGTPTIVDSRIYFGYVYDDNGNRVPTKMSMMELGFVPTFYQFVDTIIEVKISITIQASVEATNSPGAEHDRRREPHRLHLSVLGKLVVQRRGHVQRLARHHGLDFPGQRRVCQPLQLQRGRIEPPAHQARAGAAPAGPRRPHPPADGARGAVQAG